MNDAGRTPRRVAVIGGGPAGLIAAEVLARAGVLVTVYERMPTVGRKLQVAGRGGLNLTHSEPLSTFLDRYGLAARARLAPAIERFDNVALRAWADDLGQDTFVGTSGRVFPRALRATPLLRGWLRRLSELGVEIRTSHTWLGWTPGGGLSLRADDDAVVTSTPDACVLALGGASWPRTGSDGAWATPLRGAGIEVTELRPSNCGFVAPWTETFGTRFAGTPVKDVVVRHRGGSVARGDIVITRTGIEGGPVYALTATLREAIERCGHAVLEVDLLPAATESDLVARLARRRVKDSVATGLRRAGLAPVAIALLREATDNHPPSEAAALAGLLKALPIRLEAAQPIARAISTAGGVSFEEIDHRFMLTRRPGTFVAGEMLDWEAPTGGYLLQAAFSTGVAAAEGALSWLDDDRPGARPTPGD